MEPTKQSDELKAFGAMILALLHSGLTLEADVCELRGLVELPWLSEPLARAKAMQNLAERLNSTPHLTLGADIADLQQGYGVDAEPYGGDRGSTIFARATESGALVWLPFYANYFEPASAIELMAEALTKEDACPRRSTP
jgi:hypothetical protein